MQKARFSGVLRPLYDKRFARRLPHRTAAPKRDTAVPYRKKDKAAVLCPNGGSFVGYALKKRR